MEDYAITRLLYQVSQLMDEEQFDKFLKLCDTEFTYTISTYSDELGKRMVWFHKDKDGLSHALKAANRHERYTGRLRRHVGMVQVVGTKGDLKQTESMVSIFHTELNGVTRLYAIGKYCDQVKDGEDGAILVSREVKLDTRRLEFGPHVPV